MSIERPGRIEKANVENKPQPEQSQILDAVSFRSMVEEIYLQTVGSDRVRQTKKLVKQKLKDLFNLTDAEVGKNMSKYSRLFISVAHANRVKTDEENG